MENEEIVRTVNFYQTFIVFRILFIYYFNVDLLSRAIKDLNIVQGMSFNRFKDIEVDIDMNLIVREAVNEVYINGENTVNSNNFNVHFFLNIKDFLFDNFEDFILVFLRGFKVLDQNFRVIFFYNFFQTSI